ncbi:MAG TPA: NADH oxidase [Gammaproteobacteria bacterium]|jgi:NADPH2:quinone reductase|nr:NADH oxidase [Gammaproteobacteria bacterium]
MSENVSKQIRSEVTKEGKLLIYVESTGMPEPKEDEVLIRIEASPINPSDLGLLIGPADVSSMSVSGEGENAVVTMDIPEGLLRMLETRLDQSLPVGNEGGGVVVKAGSKDLEDLVGKTVGVAGGSMYSQYRCVNAASCFVMHEGVTSAESASCFVNPLTALGMVETMRLENHSALVHTAAASNLGQMLIKICLDEDVPLVNIVRKEEHVEKLNSLGAKFVCNSSKETFMQDLVSALVETGATIGFDATGGGKLSGQILTAMEVAANQTATEYNRYGSNTFKQVYIYGGLDRSPTTLNRAFGFSWGLGGWLLTPFIGRIGPERFEELKQKVADEIKTTFASHYTKEISLEEVLQPENINVYSKQATGEKYLVNPNK